MSQDLNVCSFVGRLGKDCDVRYTAAGEAVTSFSIAVGSQWKNKAGEKQEATEWVNVTAFGKLGEICGEYLKKGSQIFLSGRMKTDKYQAKDGTDKYSTKIIADHMQMLGGKSEQRGDSAEPSISLSSKWNIIELAKDAKDSVEPGHEEPAKTMPKKESLDNFEDEIPFNA